MDADLSPRCVKCFDAVIADASLLSVPGDWRLGEDAQYHWRQLGRVAGVCGVWVLHLPADDHEEKRP